MKKRVLSVLLVLTMLLSLIPAMSFAASAEGAEDLSEVIAFNYNNTAESAQFTLATQLKDDRGWAAGYDSTIVIESKFADTAITAIDAIVGFHGFEYSLIRYSSGEKVETGEVENYSTVHVKNINSNRLEISCSSSNSYVQFMDITVYYTHTSHNFSGAGRDNGDGTHSFKCVGCDEYGPDLFIHTYRPIKKVSDDTYIARCTGCPNEINNYKIIGRDYDHTGTATYQSVSNGESVKGGTQLQATCWAGDGELTVYIDGEQAAVVEEGKFWTVPQCVRCLDSDTDIPLFGKNTLKMWFKSICDYTLATCETPETCVYCGLTKGDPLGHNWKRATCTEQKICLACGKTEGNPLGHSWKDATCTAPKTCARCGAAEGEPLKHTYGLVDGMAKCTVCGKIFAPAVEETQITYTDRTWNDEDKQVVETEKEHEGVIFVDANTTVMANDNWYVVNSNVTNNNRIKVWGTANLILCDNGSLKAEAGINVAEGCTLNIYSQSEDSGKLTAVGPAACAGIGGDYRGKGGTVNIYGGVVRATGGYNATEDISGAGIGGGSGRSMEAVTVFGGTVTANGEKFGAGIGGGYNSGTCGNVTVYGGTVNATGGGCAAGIGGGAGGNGGTVIINGGVVNATGGNYGAGIGGGTVSNGGTVIINGGTVNATGGFYGAGIGGAEEGAAVTVNGGIVNAIAGEFAAGIGGGAYGNGGNVTVNGGNVTAIGGGHNSVAIGAGSGQTEEGGTLTLGDDMTFKAGKDKDNITVTGDKNNASDALGQSYVIIQENKVPFIFGSFNLVLSGELGMNFTGIVNDMETVKDGYMLFEIGKTGEQKVYLSDLTAEADGTYIFRCNINVLQMADTITVSFHYGDDVVGPHTTSVAQYLSNIVAKDPDNEKLVALAHAIENYGHYAQIALQDTHGFTLGEDGKYQTMSNYSDITLPDAADLAKYKATKTGSISEITKLSRSLALDHGTDTLLYFTCADSYTPDITVTDKDGNAVTCSLMNEESGRYVLTIPNISAHKLGDFYTVSVDGGAITINICALSYAYSTLNNTTSSENLKYAVAALYDYYQATIAYQAAPQ